MLVDDDEITNHINKLLIEDLDLAHHIAVAYNGQEALEIIQGQMIKDQQPLLILLDINMPVMDGFEFLAELENMKNLDRENIYVVILTSSNNQKDLDRTKRHKIHGYLDKPLTEEKVIQVLDKIEG